MACMEAELKLYKDQGIHYVLGTDDAGNGCIAGPVIVATCTILTPALSPIEGVYDAKELTPEDRWRIYQIIKSQPDRYAYTIATARHIDIDRTNVQQATQLAMKQSIQELVSKWDLPFDKSYSIVDGHKRPCLDIPLVCRPWVKGDSNVYTVALASILAQVEHEKYMRYAHDLYPEYGFNDHKGYSRPNHIEAIHKYGASPIHRMTAKPLKGR